MNELVRVSILNIKAGMRGLEVTGRIVHVGDVKNVETRYGPARVAQAVLRDETGSVTLNLWRAQVDTVKTGDLVRIENAFVKTFGDRIELNVGGDGKITVLSRTGKIER